MTIMDLQEALRRDRRMVLVSELHKGTLFVWENVIYRFTGRFEPDGDHPPIVQEVAVWWPDGRGGGTPPQWICREGGETQFNPCTFVDLELNHS